VKNLITKIKVFFEGIFHLVYSLVSSSIVNLYLGGNYSISFSSSSFIFFSSSSFSFLVSFTLFVVAAGLMGLLSTLPWPDLSVFKALSSTLISSS